MREIIKRNGEKVAFNEIKIENAIKTSMIESLVDPKDYESQIKEIIASIKGNTVEEIQDEVEVKLMEILPQVAKQYILYRENKHKERKHKREYTFLSKEFLSKYKTIKPPLTDVGMFVFIRTYSRFVKEWGRRENYWEAVARTVNANFEFLAEYKKDNGGYKYSDWVDMSKEAEELYDNIFNCRQFLSGRLFWVGGTEITNKNPLSIMNCSFTQINEFEDFVELMYLLMLGCGVGYSIDNTYRARNLGGLRKINIKHLEYNPVNKSDRLEYSQLDISNDGIATVKVGDSKNGWCSAIRYYFDLRKNDFYSNVKEIKFDYNSVRPFGEELKTFGGHSSGHTALEHLLQRIHEITNNLEELGDLAIMDVCGLIAQCIIVGGTRRSALICTMNENQIEAQNAKANLYEMIDGKWVINQELTQRQMSNNSIVYYEKPSFKKISAHFDKMRYSGEPGLFNMEEMIKRFNDAKGSNPCFCYDMKLLTTEGYKTFGELEDTEPMIINHKGEIVKSKVWCSGIKETIQIRLSNKKIIKCTPDHRFMNTDYCEVEAKDLKGHKIMPNINFLTDTDLDLDYVRLGFIQGDGQTADLNRGSKGVTVHVGEKDHDILNLFEVEDFDKEKERRIYVKDMKETMESLGFILNTLPTRSMPTTYDSWTKNQKASFLHGLYSANGCVNANTRISFKSTCKELIDKIKTSLMMDFNIDSYITTNKSKANAFRNGTYTCKESYDLNITRYEDLIIFSENIGFYHDYKKEKLEELLILRAPSVVSIKANGLQPVYDFIEPLTHWGIVEGRVAHNCGEIILPNKGLCNLTTVNVFSFVKEGILDLTNLLTAQRMSARAGLRTTLKKLELKKWNETQEKYRLLGCSMTGWYDMLNALGKADDREYQIELLKQLRESAVEEADRYADELGINRPYNVTTVKPEGTLSMLPTVSSGIHLNHSEYYIRRIRVMSEDPLCKLAKSLGYPMFAEVGHDKENPTIYVIEFPVKSPKGKTKSDVYAIEQLETYLMFQEHYTQHNTSITVHVRDNEWEEVKKWVYDNWDNGIAGLSFLSYDDSYYDLLPYESTTKEDYEERLKKCKPFSVYGLKKFEEDFEEVEIVEEKCSSGACPLR